MLIVIFHQMELDINFNGAYCLRPVVSLNSNIKIGDGDGSSPSSAYKIIN